MVTWREIRDARCLSCPLFLASFSFQQGVGFLRV